jgi:hypothetical protein
LKTLFDIILSRIPSALVGAIMAGVGVLILVLRGRRLEAELAQAKLREQTAKSKIHAAESWGKRAVYEKQADIAAAEVRELEKETERIQTNGEAEMNRIRNLPGHEVHRAYVDLARRAKDRAHETQ